MSPEDTERKKPIEHLRNPITWPYGPYNNNAPPEIHLIANLVMRLRDEIAPTPRTVHSVAKNAGIGDTTLRHILDGKTWPEIRTIARLERTLDTDLWGNEHR